MIGFNSVSRQSSKLSVWTFAGVFLILASHTGFGQQLPFVPSPFIPSAGAGVGTKSMGASDAANREKLGSDVSSKLSAVPEDFAKLKLDAGFLLNVQVFDSSDFSGVYRLDTTGAISLPFAGMVNLSGRTVAEAQNAIARKLVAAELFKQPQVQITVLEYTAPMVTIMGEVASPGKYPLLAERKFIEVLALAGGVTPVAGNKVEIERKDATGSHVITLNYSRGTSSASVQNVLVVPGDVIRVQRAGIVYVLGAVNRPGAYLMEEDGTLDVTQAIALAYGTSLQAALGKVRILRRNTDGSFVETQVDYKQIMKANVSPVTLNPGDIVYVPLSKMKTALLDSQSVLSSAASATVYNGLVR